MFIQVLLSTKSLIKWRHRCSHIKIYYAVYKKKELEGCKDQINEGRGERQNMSQDRDEKRKQNIVMQTCNKHLEVSYLKISAKQCGFEHLFKYLLLLLVSLHARWKTPWTGLLQIGSETAQGIYLSLCM